MRANRGWVAAVGGMVLALAMVATTAVAEESPNVGRLPGGVASGIERYDNSITGELFADILGTSISVQRQFVSALPSIYSYSQTAHYQDRADLGSSNAYASADQKLISSSYGACPTTMCSPGSRWVMWDVPFMVNETKKRDDGYLGYEQTVSGFATGISRLIGESSAIGLAIGYDYRKLNGRDGYHMKNRADAFHAALYGGTNIGHFFFDAYAGYSRTWNRTHRSVYDPVGTSQYAGNYCDTVLSAGAKASYVWIFSNDIRITPSVGIDVSHVRSSGFTETQVTNGGGNNDRLGVDKNTYTKIAVPIMVSANKTFSSSRFLCFGGKPSLWTPEVRGGYVPQFGSKRARADVAFLDGANAGARFSSKSTSMADDYGTVGAGVKIKLRDKYIFAVDYDYSFASEYQNHTVTAMYGVSF